MINRKILCVKSKILSFPYSADLLFLTDRKATNKLITRVTSEGSSRKSGYFPTEKGKGNSFFNENEKTFDVGVSFSSIVDDKKNENALNKAIQPIKQNVSPPYNLPHSNTFRGAKEAKRGGEGGGKKGSPFTTFPPALSSSPKEGGGDKRGEDQKFFNQCFDKGRLKNFVLWFLLNYGEHKTVSLVEQLKNIGFEYASKAGISLGVDDLKIPPKKANLIYDAENQTNLTIAQYRRGEITGVERFQRLIDTWHRTSEVLKQEVIDYFEETDILNPVYMMAFSGARGNISQVRQLVGMRGLMADPQGQIIDFPIRSNFREGLTVTEYIISSYGARKGIVDTALRTANAGYLTRRLVDVAQHVIISNFDCGTTRGIFLTNMKEGNKTIHSLSQRIVGRILARDIFTFSPSSLLSKGILSGGESSSFTLASGEVREGGNKTKTQIKIASRNEEVTLELAMLLSKKLVPSQGKAKIFVRSPLTCEKPVCQLCYGWSLAQGKMVSIGEAVGVVAAQSIGEPGTQLTMRTFHTGGVFSGDVSDQIKAPFDGIIEYISAIPGTLIRTPEGKIAFLTKSEGSFIVKKVGSGFYTDKPEDKPINNLVQKTPAIKKFTIPHHTLLYIRNGQNVYEKEVIAQISSISQKTNATDDAELTIKSEIEGQFYSKFLGFREKIVGPPKAKSLPPTSTGFVLAKPPLSLMGAPTHSWPQGGGQETKGRGVSSAVALQVFSYGQQQEKIYEAWTWGFAWILSGKIYDYKNSCSFQSATPSLSIVGDLLNTKSLMTQTQWSLGSFSKGPTKGGAKNTITFDYNKRTPSCLLKLAKESFNSQNQKSPLSLLFSSNSPSGGKKNLYKNEKQLKNCPKATPNKTTQILFIDLNQIVFKKYGYVLEISKKHQFITTTTSLTLRAYPTVEEQKTKGTKREGVIKEALGRTKITTEDSNYDFLFFSPSLTSENKQTEFWNSTDMSLLSPNIRSPRKQPYILQWFPNQYKTQLGGVLVFENSQVKQKNIQFASSSVSFDSIETNFPLFSSSKNLSSVSRTKANNEHKIKTIEHISKINRNFFLKTRQINNSKILFIPSEVFKVSSVALQFGEDKSTDSHPYFMSMFLNKHFSKKGQAYSQFLQQLNEFSQSPGRKDVKMLKINSLIELANTSISQRGGNYLFQNAIQNKQNFSYPPFYPDTAYSPLFSYGGECKNLKGNQQNPSMLLKIKKSKMSSTCLTSSLVEYHPPQRHFGTTPLTTSGTNGDSEATSFLLKNSFVPPLLSQNQQLEDGDSFVKVKKNTKSLPMVLTSPTLGGAKKESSYGFDASHFGLIRGKKKPLAVGRNFTSFCKTIGFFSLKAHSRGYNNHTNESKQIKNRVLLYLNSVYAIEKRMTVCIFVEKLYSKFMSFPYPTSLPSYSEERTSIYPFAKQPLWLLTNNQRAGGEAEVGGQRPPGIVRSLCVGKANQYLMPLVFSKKTILSVASFPLGSSEPLSPTSPEGGGTPEGSGKDQRQRSSAGLGRSFHTFVTPPQRGGETNGEALPFVRLENSRYGQNRMQTNSVFHGSLKKGWVVLIQPNYSSISFSNHDENNQKSTESKFSPPDKKPSSIFNGKKTIESVHQKIIYAGQSIFNEFYFHMPVFVEALLFKKVFNFYEISSFSSLPGIAEASPLYCQKPSMSGIYDHKSELVSFSYGLSQNSDTNLGTPLNHSGSLPPPFVPLAGGGVDPIEPIEKDKDKVGEKQSNQSGEPFSSKNPVKEKTSLKWIINKKCRYNINATPYYPGEGLNRGSREEPVSGKDKNSSWLYKEKGGQICSLQFGETKKTEKNSSHIGLFFQPIQEFQPMDDFEMKKHTYESTIHIFNNSSINKQNKQSQPIFNSYNKNVNSVIKSSFSSRFPLTEENSFPLLTIQRRAALRPQSTKGGKTKKHKVNFFKHLLSNYSMPDKTLPVAKQTPPIPYGEEGKNQREAKLIPFSYSLYKEKREINKNNLLEVPCSLPVIFYGERKILVNQSFDSLLKLQQLKTKYLVKGVFSGLDKKHLDTRVDHFGSFVGFSKSQTKMNFVHKPFLSAKAFALTSKELGPFIRLFNKKAGPPSSSALAKQPLSFLPSGGEVIAKQAFSRREEMLRRGEGQKDQKTYKLLDKLFLYETLLCMHCSPYNFTSSNPFGSFAPSLWGGTALQRQAGGYRAVNMFGTSSPLPLRGQEDENDRINKTPTVFSLDTLLLFIINKERVHVKKEETNLTKEFKQLVNLSSVKPLLFQKEHEFSIQSNLLTHTVFDSSVFSLKSEQGSFNIDKKSGLEKSLIIGTRVRKGAFVEKLVSLVSRKKINVSPFLIKYKSVDSLPEFDSVQSVALPPIAETTPINSFSERKKKEAFLIESASFLPPKTAAFSAPYYRTPKGGGEKDPKGGEGTSTLASFHLGRSFPTFVTPPQRGGETNDVCSRRETLPFVRLGLDQAAVRAREDGLIYYGKLGLCLSDKKHKHFNLGQFYKTKKETVAAKQLQDFKFSYLPISKFDCCLYPFLSLNFSSILDFYLLNNSFSSSLSRRGVGAAPLWREMATLLTVERQATKVVFTPAGARTNQKHSKFAPPLHLVTPPTFSSPLPRREGIKKEGVKVKEKMWNSARAPFVAAVFNSFVNNLFESPCFSFNLQKSMDLSAFKKTKTPSSSWPKGVASPAKTKFLYNYDLNQNLSSILLNPVQIDISKQKENHSYQRLGNPIQAKTNYYSPFKGEIVYSQTIAPKDKLIFHDNFINDSIESSFLAKLRNDYSQIPFGGTLQAPISSGNLERGVFVNKNTRVASFSYSCMFLTKQDLVSYYLPNYKHNDLEFKSTPLKNENGKLLPNNNIPSIETEGGAPDFYPTVKKGSSPSFGEANLRENVLLHESQSLNYLKRKNYYEIKDTLIQTKANYLSLMQNTPLAAFNPGKGDNLEIVEIDQKRIEDQKNPILSQLSNMDILPTATIQISKTQAGKPIITGSPFRISNSNNRRYPNRETIVVSPSPRKGKRGQNPNDASFFSNTLGGSVSQPIIPTENLGKEIQSVTLLGDFYSYGDPISQPKLDSSLLFSSPQKDSFVMAKDVGAENNAVIQISGQVVHYNKTKITIRRAQPVFISPKGILHKFDGDFIDPKSPVITLSYQRLKTGDIIQGIPKVEQFFEARTTKRGRLFRDSLPSLLKALFKRYQSKMPLELAVRQSFYKIQQIIVDGVQRVYKSQGVTISDKHLEVIVKQMTSKVRIIDGAQTGFFPGEVVDLMFVEKINTFLIKKITYEPVVLGITKASLEVDSFLSASSFQQTTRILSQAAMYRKKDFLKGLKENVILGNLIPAGTGYLVYLDDF